LPENVEIKAVVRDWKRAHRTARELSGSAAVELKQVDVFFRSPKARLKLRTLAADQGELILYDRPNLPSAKISRYIIARTKEPQKMVEILSSTFGVIGTVRKTRFLYLVGQTRIHLDQVDGLGRFLEFEVVLRRGQTEADGCRIAGDLMRKFGIAPDQLLARSYLEMLTREDGPTSPPSSPPLDCHSRR
jgi:predicted adenylyl cyclase CyaB